ncbi:hypothetical protein GC176_16865 [bacterium]|nr:hypothetical protein [bacterium]
MNLTARCCSLRALVVSAVCLLAVCVGPAGLLPVEARAADAAQKMPDAKPLQSGPEVGATIHSFFVRAVTGPHRNRSVCYVCRYGSRPVVAVFIQDVDPELPKLLKAIDGYVDENRVSGLRSFGVLVTDDSASVVPILQTMAFDERIRMPLTASTTTIAGQDSLRLHEKAATTVVLYRDQRAVSTLAFAKGKIDDAAVVQTLRQVQSLIDSDQR